MMVAVAGVDVSKASLDVSIAEGVVKRLHNTAAGFERLLRHLCKEGATVVVCESTGGYERGLVRRLRDVAFPVRVAHPNRVRAFARVCGYEAKTDPLDAQVLSRYGRLFPQPEPQSPEPGQQELRDLLRRRQQLVAQRVQERNRLGPDLADRALQSTQRHIAWLDHEIAQLDREYQEVLKRAAPLNQRAARYRTVPGVGPITAATLVAELPELGNWDPKALTALVGLAPWSRDSGKQQKPRAIRGGRGVVRRVLYLAALSAIRVDAELRSFHQRLLQRGKPGKVALVAVMRKLLLRLHAVAQRGTPWTPAASTQVA